MCISNVFHKQSQWETIHIKNRKQKGKNGRLLMHQSHLSTNDLNAPNVGRKSYREVLYKDSFFIRVKCYSIHCSVS